MRVADWLARPEVHRDLGPYVRSARIVAGDDAADWSRDADGHLQTGPHHDPEFVVTLDEAARSRLDAPWTDDVRFEATLAFFWPVTWWSLRRRRARDWILQLGVEVENVVHFTFVAPDGAHRLFTALNLNAEWAWVPGHVFRPSRVFRLDLTAMREWLTEVFAATTARDDYFWEPFMAWYAAFRERHSELHPNEARAASLLAELARYDHPDEDPPEEPW